MKKLLLITCLFANFVLIPCIKMEAKRGPVSKGITAVVDGVTKTFNTASAAFRVPGSNVEIIEINGAHEPSGLVINIMITKKGSKAGTGSYTTNNTSTDVYIGLYDTKTQQLYENSAIKQNTQVTATITSISADGVKGTFNGKLALSAGNDYKTITNGSFDMAFAQ